MKRKEYEIPRMDKMEVELEKGFMKASIFDPENQQDDGVNISGHEVGNTGDYTDLGWDNDGTTSSTWGN